MDKYTRAATELIGLLGGVDNITALTCCITRLRVTLTDRQVIDDTGLREHPAVLGRLDGDDGAVHLIVGPAAVAPLTRACTDLLTTP